MLVMNLAALWEALDFDDTASSLGVAAVAAVTLWRRWRKPRHRGEGRRRRGARFARPLRAGAAARDTIAAVMASGRESFGDRRGRRGV